MLAESFLRSGKVRDLYSVPGGRLVLTASDRISAFDVVLPSLIPDKGRVLTALSRFWFAETAGIVPNHLLDTDIEVLRQAFAAPASSNSGLSLGDLRGRIMICRPTQVVPIEAVVRGYLAGSGWKEYRERGTVCGIQLPPGLRESDRLPEPIFTPATKAEAGAHDENLSFDGMIEYIAAQSLDPAWAGPLAEAIRQRAMALYGYGAAIAARRGILLADTKFEFGLAVPSLETAGGRSEDGLITLRLNLDLRSEMIPDGWPESSLILIDEVMTPDSSRFWDAASYGPGRPQASFDKQFVRDWLETQDWDKTAPGPELPAEVIEGTRARYLEAYERITGASFKRYLEEDVIAP